MSVHQARPSQHRVRVSEQLELACWEWPGDGPTILMHHGNGFCAALYGAIARKLSPHYRVLAFDARGHGDSDRPETGYAWEDFSRDLRRVVEALRERLNVRSFALGVGHSFGATVMLHAVQASPGLFDRLLLLEPVIVPRSEAERPGMKPGSARWLSLLSRHRTASFVSVDAARKALRNQPLYRDWADEVFNDYLEHGLRREGEACELKCAPETEARVFELGSTERLFTNQIVTPTLLLYGTRGWFPVERYRALEPWFVQLQLEPIDASHSLPMERPDEVFAQIERSLGGLAMRVPNG